MNDENESNRNWWDEVTPLHIRSTFYDIPGFLAGRSSLGKVEQDLLGDIRGKRVLHLQCHFGLDSLSMARLGAQVTGVDFSSVAIREAEKLAQITQLDNNARFICCDMFRLNQTLHERFDIVFTSHGVLEWLSDLDAWGELVGSYLNPAGVFVIAEVHPFSLIFNEHDEEKLIASNSYLMGGRNIDRFNQTDYTDRNFVPKARRTKMLWSISDVLNSLIKGGLTLRDFREFPYSTYRHFSPMEKRGDGYWYLPAPFPTIPLMFALTAANA